MLMFKQSHPWFYKKVRKYKWSLGSYFRGKGLIRIHSDLLGGDMLVYPNDAVSESIYLDNFETETVRLFKRIVKLGDCVYDIGANIGYLTLLFSKLVGPAGQIHAFEPSRREITVLGQNIMLNGITNVFLNQLAVCDQTGYDILTVLNEGKDGVYNSLGKINHRRAAEKQNHEELVKTICLDDYVESYKNLPSIMKIDTEGAELLVLQGASRILSSSTAPMIVLEECAANLTGFKSSVKELRQLLLDHGYQLFKIKPDGSLDSGESNSEQLYSVNIVAAKSYHLSNLSVN